MSVLSRFNLNEVAVRVVRGRFCFVRSPPSPPGTEIYLIEKNCRLIVKQIFVNNNYINEPVCGRQIFSTQIFENKDSEKGGG